MDNVRITLLNLFGYGYLLGSAVLLATMLFDPSIVPRGASTWAGISLYFILIFQALGGILMLKKARKLKKARR